MNAEIISVGAAYVSGDAANGNAAYLAERLLRLGIRVTRQTAVNNTPEEITSALAAAVAHSPIIVFTGGLGTEETDRTKEIVCAAVGLPLVERAESLKRLQSYYNAREEEMPAAARRLAMFPESAALFANPAGPVEGCALASGNQSILLLPGDSRQLQAMFEASAEDYLMGKTDRTMACRTLKVFGMSESKVKGQLADLLTQTDPAVAVLAGAGDVRVKITAADEDRAACEKRCRETTEQIAAMLGNAVYARENVSLQQTVVELLLARGKKIATAESCTAGMLSEMLTDVSGASQVFEFGVSAYANRVKQEALDVPADLLKKHGAVSSQVAEAMAKGAAKKGKADFGVGITGIAGPTGGTPEKPVGLVYISLFDGTRCFTRKLLCNPESPREKIRLSAAMNALDMVRLYLVGDPRFLGQTKAPAAKPAKQKKKWWQSLFPVKGDSPSQVVRKCIMLLCLVVFIGSAVYIVDYFVESAVTRQQQSQLSDKFHTEAAMNKRFEDLLQINPDTVAWLTVPGTLCDNPVVKTSDNNKYLDTTFEGSRSKYGTLFADAACRIEKPSSAEADVHEGLSQNIIVYGHHMRDGTMFGQLKFFREFAFYQKHPTLEFTTLYDGSAQQYKIVALYIVNTYAIDDSDTVFNYRQVGFADEYAYLRYVDECRQRSVINTTVDVEYGDQLLTLSTCTYEFDNARLVMLARQVRPGESADVDVENASINFDAVYPKAYYRATGSKGRTNVRSFVYAPSSSTPRTVRPSSASAASSQAASSQPSSVPVSHAESSNYTSRIHGGSTVSLPSENPWESSHEIESEPEESAIESVPSQETPGESSEESSTPEESQTEESSLSEPESQPATSDESSEETSAETPSEE